MSLVRLGVPDSDRTAELRIPLARPDLSGNEILFVNEALESTWISSTGRFIDRFESEFASLCDTASSVTVCNGTVALHLALLALNVRPGDEVLVPSLTYIAVANAVRYMGAEPVFVDVDPNNWCIDARLIEENISHRTRGIIVVHTYGHPADMAAINAVAAIHGLWVVEDAAEAHGATYHGRPVGGLADVGTFSFYGNKIISSGEGGAVTVNDAQLEVRLRTLRGQGVDPNRRYYFPVTGYNFRLTNVASAILCGQLEHFDDMIQRRQDIFKRYKDNLAGCDAIGFQPSESWAMPAPWLFNITVESASGMSAAELGRALEGEGIETRPFFIPLHTLPPFRHVARRLNIDCPISDRLATKGLSLPTFSGMAAEEVDEVSQAIHTFIG